MDPLLSKMSDTALAELRTIIELPRTLREMMSSPTHEINKRVYVRAGVKRGAYQTAETNLELSRGPHRSQGPANSQGLGLLWGSVEEVKMIGHQRSV